METRRGQRRRLAFALAYRGVVPETTRSPLALAALATAAIPGLDVIAARPPRVPGADFDVAAVLDSERNRWVVRAPRTAAAGAAMEGEIALLHHLGRAADDGLLGFQVPRPAGFAALPEGGRAMIYPELVGSPLRVDDIGPGPGLAAEVGRALAKLHELDTSVVADAGLPTYDADAYRRRRLNELDEAARTGHVPASLLRRWEHALENVSLWRFKATVVHGDLASEHVLVQGQQVRGVLDWSESRVADPADDLAWLYAEAGDEGLESVLEAYALGRTEGADEHITDRALLAGELALVRWLMHGVRVRDGEIIDDAIAMLGQLAVDLADAPGIGRSEPAVERIDPIERVAPSGDVATDGDDDGDPHGQGVPEPSGHETAADTDELQVPDYAREDGSRGGDDSPTTSLPRQSPETGS